MSPSGSVGDWTEPMPGSESKQTGGSDPNKAPQSTTVANRHGASSSLSGRLRRATITLGQSGLPEGPSAAAGNIASSIASRKHAGPRSPLGSAPKPHSPAKNTEHDFIQGSVSKGQSSLGISSSDKMQKDQLNEAPRLGKGDEPAAAADFPNGYHFSPAHSLVLSTKLGLMTFWRYFLTPLGFCVTFYGLNIVAWGGMLFLLLCNASPAMCHPTCNDIDSPRRKRMEWDSQILNALFCVTGFGLAPWRFRDLWFILQFRLARKSKRHSVAWRASIVAGSDCPLLRRCLLRSAQTMLRSNTACGFGLAVPYPETKIPDPPLTGIRASSTPIWKLDLVIWLMVWNTFLQCCLAGVMWGMNRYDRPSWATGLFVGLACVVAGAGGLMMFLEGKKVKAVEGVAVSEHDLRNLENDREQGIWHYNNIKDKQLQCKGKKVNG